MVFVFSVISVGPVNAYEDESKIQRKVLEMVQISPKLKAYADEAMRLFRDKEGCGTRDESKRPPGSKPCGDLTSVEQAEARSAADLKACQDACNKDAAGAVAASVAKAQAKGKEAADLAKCVDDGCKEECSRKEILFRTELDQFLKGSFKSHIQMNEWSTTKEYRELFKAERRLND